jgi:RNA polymerase sigma factor (sigma-70 family)
MSKEHQDIEENLWKEYWHCRDSGDVVSMKKARNDLVLFYVEGSDSLVQRIARRMISIGQFKMEDRESTLISLVNEGAVPLGNRQEGLIYAIEHYDGSIPFEVYAYDLIRYSIFHGVTADPGQRQHVVRLAREYKKYWKTFTDKLHREPKSLQELADFLGISLKRVTSRQISYFYMYPDTLIDSDEQIGEENSRKKYQTTEVSTLNSAALSPEEEFFRRTEIDDLKKALNILKPKELQIIIMKYIEDKTDEQIATNFKTTPGNVRVILSRSINKLRALSK